MTDQNMPANPRPPLSPAHRGQGLLEFGLILPLLLLLVFGAIEAGRMLVIYSSLSSAGNQAVRYGAVAGDYDVLTAGDQPFYNNCQGIRATARRAALFVPLDDTSISIRYERGSGTITQTLGLCAPNAVTPTVALTSTAPIVIQDGDRMVISITAVYRPIVPIVPLPALPMTFAAARTIFTIIVGPTPTRPPNPDLDITKADGPDPVFPDDPLVYTITVRNNSGGDAVDIIITDTLPSQITTYPEQTGNPGFRWSPPQPWVCADPPSPQTYPIQIRCTYPLPLRAGASVALPITVTAPTTPGITISNQVLVGSAVTETITTNNIATATTTLVTGADMVVTKSAAPTVTVNGDSSWVYGGNLLTYTLTVKNNGPQSEGQGGQNQIVLTDTLPTGATFISRSFGSTWQSCSSSAPIVCTSRNNVNLASGGSMDPITIVISVPTTAHGASLVNSVAISTTKTTDPKPRNNTFTLTNTVSLSADLAVGKTASTALVDGGQAFSYTVRVTNTAGALASGIVITDSLTMSSGTYSVAGTGWTCNPSSGSGGGQIVCTYSGSLLAGQAANPIIFTVVPNANTTLANSVVVSSPQPDPNSSNNSATAPAVVVNNCDVNTASTADSIITASPTEVQTDAANTGNFYSTVTVELHNGCSSHALVTTSQTVTLVTSRVINDTINVVGGSGATGTTTTGSIQFRVRSNAAGTSFYTASSNGGAPFTDDAFVNYFDCVSGGAGPVGGGNQNVAFLYTNNAGYTMRLIEVSLTWPSQGSRALTSLVFGSTTIWSGSSNSNPFVASSTGTGLAFVGTSTDREVANGSSKILTLNFNYNVQSGGGSNSFVLTSKWADTSGSRQCSITTTVTR